MLQYSSATVISASMAVQNSNDNDVADSSATVISAPMAVQNSNDNDFADSSATVINTPVAAQNINNNDIADSSTTIMTAPVTAQNIKTFEATTNVSPHLIETLNSFMAEQSQEAEITLEPHNNIAQQYQHTQQQVNVQNQLFKHSVMKMKQKNENTM